MRYLTELEVTSTLRRGSGIAQFLPGASGSGTFAWLAMSGSGVSRTLRLHQVVDDGRDDFLDVWEFSPVDEKEYLGEGRVLDISKSTEDLLITASTAGAVPDRWLNESMIQGMYAERRRLIMLVESLQHGGFASQAATDAALADFEASVPYPGASRLIFWPAGFPHDPDAGERSAAEVVDEALAYRAIEL
jgi:hypothetical protein